MKRNFSGSFVSAFNMYKGGSKTIFDQIAEELRSNDNVVILKASSRFALKERTICVKYPIRYFNWLYRLLIENLIVPFCALLFFRKRLIMLGNFPSLFWFGEQRVFFHNTLYIESTSEESIKFKFEKKLFEIAIRTKSPILLVQTVLMKQLLQSHFSRKLRISVIGTPKPRKLEARIKNTKAKIILLYPAKLYPHKNHQIIFFWQEMLTDLNCEVWLTVSETELNNAFKNLNLHPSIKCIGEKTTAELNEIYEITDALIFPSKKESLGLPLVEAALNEIPVIAENLPYVNAVIDGFYAYDHESGFPFAVRKCIHDIEDQRAIKPIIKINVETKKFTESLISCTSDQRL